MMRWDRTRCTILVYPESNPATYGDNMAMELTFENAESRGEKVTLNAHPQTSVTAGETANTAIINTPDGRRYVVVGDYRDVQLKIQAASAQGHESGEAPRKNTPMS